MSQLKQMIKSSCKKCANYEPTIKKHFMSSFLPLLMINVMFVITTKGAVLKFPVNKNVPFSSKQ